ncbi:MAG TPA: hemolysin family protein [Pyrinomonadaceae bacterium]
MESVLSIAAVLFLVVANGFFVASEFALVGVRRSRVETLAASGHRGAARLLGLLDDLNAYISATQLGITMASLALGWIGEPVVAHFLEAPLRPYFSETALHTISFAVAFTIITFLHIVLGELAPKTVALEMAERVALAVSWPLLAFYTVFQWPIRLLDWAGTGAVRLFGLRPSRDHASAYTEDELRHLIGVSQQSGHLEAAERQLLDRVFEFGDAEVREALVPRTEVEALPSTATLEEARAAFLSTGYSRLPVYRERLDDIVGLLFRKDIDMGQARPDGFDLERLARAPVFVPAAASLGDALKQMQSSRVHFVFVLDEHGGLEGILTLEDLLEEIVGEIDDEYDEEAKSQILPQPDGAFLLDGMLAVRDANRHLPVALPEDGHYTTLAGFLLARAGRLLKPGDAVEHDGGVFVVEQVEGRRIRRVRYAPPAAAPDEQEAA